MKALRDIKTTRREFFRASARYVLLAGLAAAGAMAVRRKGEQCVNSGICGSCGSFANCGLPQALSARQARQGKVTS